MPSLSLPRKSSGLSRPSWWHAADWWLVGATLGLMIFGLAMLASISLGTDQPYFTNQLLFSAVGLVIYFALSRFDYRLLLSWSLLGYAVVVVLLLVVVILGQTSHGAESWLRLGPFSLQPSEFAKLVLVALFAWVASWTGRQSWSWWQALIAWSVLLVPPFFLTLIQPDFGTASVMLVVWLVTVWVSPVNKRVLAGLMVCVVAAAAVGWLLLAPYQQQRITTFLNPSAQPLGTGYNVLQSQIAVGSGMWFGQGWGRGTQSHLNFLPEHHSDFIFAALSEELGLVGSLTVLGLYGIILWRGALLAWHATDQPTLILIVGVMAMILFQAVINIGMNIGVAPITGIPLPLVSYGGSSLLMTLAALGLLQSVARHQSDVLRSAGL